MPPAPPFGAARSVRLRDLMSVAGSRCFDAETSEGLGVLKRSRVLIEFRAR